MKLILYFILFVRTSNAADLQYSNVVNIGGPSNSANPSHIIPTQTPGSLASQLCLVAGVVSGSQSFSNYYGFYSMNSPVSQSQYQVPAGKSFYATSFSAIIQAAGWLQMGYGMGPLAAEGTPTAPLTPIYFASSSASGAAVIYDPDLSLWRSWHWVMKFPAGAFPFLRYSTTANNFAGVLCGILH